MDKENKEEDIAVPSTAAILLKSLPIALCIVCFTLGVIFLIISAIQ